MRGPSSLYIEERHRALGRDATFSWSRALTHPPRCNRTRHRGRHLDFVGAAILDRKSWGPPSWCRGGRHLGPEVTSKTLKWRLYYYFKQHLSSTYTFRVRPWHFAQIQKEDKGSLTVWALYAYFSDSQNAAFELLVWCM